MPVFDKLTENTRYNFDVIFIHGLFGQGVQSWTNENNSFCWLNALEEEGHFTVWVSNYDFVQDIVWSDENTLKRLSTDLINKMIFHGIGKNPILFVGHDLGGLVIKQTLLCLESDQSDWKQIKNNSLGFIFISVPHCHQNIDRWFNKCFTERIHVDSKVEDRVRNDFLRINSIWKDSNFFQQSNQSDRYSNYYVIPNSIGSANSLVGEEMREIGHRYIQVRSTHDLIHQPTGIESEVFGYTLTWLRECFSRNIIEYDNGDLAFRSESHPIIHLANRTPKITDLDDENTVKSSTPENLYLRLWKEIHQLADDIKNELRIYYIFCLYNQSGNLYNQNKIINHQEIVKHIDSLCNESLVSKIQEIDKIFQKIDQKDENFIHTTLNKYTKFLLEINDVLLTVRQCLTANPDKDKKAAELIQKWLDVSLQQADQIIKKYIEKKTLESTRRNFQS